MPSFKCFINTIFRGLVHFGGEAESSRSAARGGFYWAESVEDRSIARRVVAAVARHGLNRPTLLHIGGNGPSRRSRHFVQNGPSVFVRARGGSSSWRSRLVDSGVLKVEAIFFLVGISPHTIL